MFNALYRSLVMAWRMLKNAFLRPLRALYGKVRRAASLTRQVSRVVPRVVKSVTTVKVKPKAREDYVDAGPVYVAKSLIFIVIGAVISLWLLGQFVVWPWMESRWFTARLYVEEERAQNYTGKAQLFADENKSLLLFEGRLSAGRKTGKGREYHENGVEAYIGAFEEGLYSGQGIVQDSDGSVIYDGGFAGGLYDGEGKLYADNALLYEGGFSQGEYDGEGRLYEGGMLVYEGEFAQGARSGQGKAYQDGALVYEGGFADGAYSGAGKTYYPDGKVRAECLTFAQGKLDGACVLYYENGRKKYEGSFSQDEASGTGTLYNEAGDKTYYGGFEAGLKAGNGTEFFPGGRKKYEGEFALGAYDGSGTLYNADGTVLYQGGFSQGQYAGEGRLNLDGGAAVEGTFAAGEIAGAAQYYEGGALVYEGEMAAGQAQGAGTLYAGGASVYTGGWAGGFIDGRALLDLPVTDLRQTVFAGAALAETEAERGFVIQNGALSAAVFCNYGYDDAEIVVHRVYLYGDSLRARFDGAEFAVPDGALSAQALRDVPLLLPGVPASVQAAHDCIRYDYGEYTLRVWTDEEGRADLIEWRSLRDLASQTGGEGAQPDPEGSMVDDLLASLGFGSGEEGAQEPDGTDGEEGATGDAAPGADGTAADGPAANGGEAQPDPDAPYDGLRGEAVTP